VVKPFDEGDLLEVVQKALADHDELQSHSLVVADDDPDTLALMEHALVLHGYQVHTAHDGQQALAQVQQFQPDLVLLDLDMPVMDGYEVVRRLRNDDATRPIPIIVITASPVDSERGRVPILGTEVAQYVTKPLSIEILVREIKKVIASKSLAQQDRHQVPETEASGSKQPEREAE
jgi:CheY-like chemotaxis protein